jgi:hypothetical protein
VRAPANPLILGFLSRFTPTAARPPIRPRETEQKNRSSRSGNARTTRRSTAARARSLTPALTFH